MTNRNCNRAAAALVLAALALSVDVLGQQAQPCPADSAETLVTEGRKLFGAGDNAGAYEKFRCAFQKLKSYDVSGNLGLTELELGKYVEAAEHLSYAVRNWPVGGSQQKREQRVAVEERLARARTHVLAVSVAVNRAGAIVSVDGRTVGLAPLDAPIFLQPGQHTIAARAEGFPTASKQVEGSAGSDIKVDLIIPSPEPAAKPAPRASAVVPAKPIAKADRASTPRMSALAWTGFTLGGASLIAAAATGAISAKMVADVKRECTDDVCPTRLKGDIDTTLALARASTALFVAVGVGVALGIGGLFVPAEPKNARSAVRIALSASAADARLRIDF